MSLPRLVATIVAVTLLDGVTSGADNRPASDRMALATLFHEQHVADSALQVHEQAAALPPQARLEFLTDWVLPSEDHPRFRLQAAFTPAHPPPAQGRPLPEGRLVETGGKIVSPALDLIEAARESGTLDALQERIESVVPVSPLHQIEQLSLLALVAMGMRDVPAASRQLDQVLEQYFAGPGSWNDAEDPVLLCVHAACDFPELSQQVVGPSYQILARCREEDYHRSPWLRHFSAACARANRMATDGADRSREQNSAPSSEQWFPVSRKLAAHRGSGCPIALWEFQSGRIDNFISHDDDYLYFQSPLLGDYSVECDVTGFGWRDSQLLVAGQWIGPVYDHQSYDIGTIRRVAGRTTFTPPLTRTKDYIRYRTAVRQETATTWFNGREIHNEPLEAVYEPWLAIRSSPRHDGGVRDLLISGDVSIPDTLILSQTKDLSGWIPYYDDQVGSDWVQQDDEIRARHQQQYPAGCHKENLLVYQRPMLEDGSIEYEFWYAPEQFDAHPVLDRLCFLLQPAGVTVHWITDGRYERTSLGPDNSLVEEDARQGAGALPLMENDWNHVRMTTRGDVVQLELNDQLIYERPIESTNQRTFGLFHYADRTGLRVRDIVWTGAWPKELPPLEAQQLAVDEAGFLDERLSMLTAKFEHDFVEDGLALNRFAVVRGDVPAHLSAEPDGLHAGRPAVEGYRNATVAPRLRVSGDFDIQASFEGLVTDCHGSGSSNLMLIAITDDELPDEALLLRRRTRARGGDLQIVQCARVFHVEGDQRRRYFDHLPVEAMAGTLRLARRGNQIYFLFAENDSRRFRLFGQADFPTTDLQTEGVRLVAQIHGDQGEVRVVWKSLSIRAEGLDGVATGQVDHLLTELNEQRAGLAESFTRDFTSEAPSDEAFRRWTDLREWQHSDGGLLMAAPGTDDWSSAGAALRTAIDGDFDIAASLDPGGLAVPASGEESSIYLQLELDDEARTQCSCIFKKSATGNSEVTAQLRVPDQAGGYHYRRIGRLAVTTVERLRIARRGQRVYYLATAPDFDGERVIASTHVTAAPVRREGTKLMVHTGGAGRQSQVVWQDVRVHAERLVRSNSRPQPQPGGRLLFDLLFD